MSWYQGALAGNRVPPGGGLTTTPPEPPLEGAPASPTMPGMMPPPPLPPPGVGSGWGPEQANHRAAPAATSPLDIKTSLGARLGVISVSLDGARLNVVPAACRDYPSLTRLDARSPRL